MTRGWRLWVRASVLGVVAALGLAASATAGHGRAPSPLQWLSSAELKVLLERSARQQIHLIDLRPAAAFQAGHLPGARSIPLAELGRRAREIPLGRVVLYCDCPGVELEGAHGILWNFGWDDLYALSDGFSGWLQQGYPVSR